MAPRHVQKTAAQQAAVAGVCALCCFFPHMMKVFSLPFRKTFTRGGCRKYMLVNVSQVSKLIKNSTCYAGLSLNQYLRTFCLHYGVCAWAEREYKGQDDAGNSMSGICPLTKSVVLCFALSAVQNCEIIYKPFMRHDTNPSHVWLTNFLFNTGFGESTDLWPGHRNQ